MKQLRKDGMFRAIFALCTVTMILGGCGQNQGSSTGVSETQMMQETMQIPKIAPMPQVPNDVNGAEIKDLMLLDTANMFSKEDEKADYDEALAVNITLNKSEIGCDSSQVQTDGSTATITDEGTYILAGSLENGSIIVDASDSDIIQLVLNNVDINCNDSAAIYVKKAGKVVITLAENAENKLSVSGEFEEADDNNIDGVIFSKADLTLNGEGSLKTDTSYGHGIVSKDDLRVIGGNYDIKVNEKGISGKDSVRIAGGNFVITAGEDGIYSENTEDITKGFVYIAGGTYDITVEDDAIHAGAQLLIAGGNINISKCEEGLEGMSVDIQGGDISLVSNDDGVNASVPDELTEAAAKLEKKGCFIRIGGGTLDVTTGGDGIDANGSLYISGGVINVSGPISNDNGSIDYDEEGLISGGVLVTAGYSGMTQGFGNGSTQRVVTARLSQRLQRGNLVELKDTDGNTLVSFAPKADYDFVMISCPELKVGNTYTLYAGTESQELEVTEQSFGNDIMPGGRPAGMPGGRTGGMPEGRPGGMSPNISEQISE